MKISFYQQAVTETERQTGDNHSVRGANRGEKTVPADGFCMTEKGWGGMPGKTVEKGKSLIELQQEAQNIDVGVSQDYMTLMSNTLSEEDYARLQKDGFDFGDMNPQETVTIVDKIKAELVRSGKNIAGYTDDLDMNTLAEALGSQALAESIARSFAQADIPLTEENLEQISAAWAMQEQLVPLAEGSIRYLLDNEMSSEIWNLYVAENSGAAGGGKAVPEFAENVPGYYTRNGGGQQSDELSSQIDNIILRSGRELDEESRKAAAWILENGLPLTEENLSRLEELKNLDLPVSEERFGEAVAEAVVQGKNPVHADLGKQPGNLYEKAAELADYYHSEDVWAASAGDITARRQLEEIRLRMTAEVNVKLLKSGFSIDTEPMERLVEALKQAEQELAAQYFPDDNLAVEKYRSFSQAENVIRDLPGLPAEILGAFAEGQSRESLDTFHGQGKALQSSYEKAGESYEALMTAPRGDLGDSIKKAFSNVDDILNDLGRELTEENRRAVRILGYNRMEMNLENLDRVREADRQVQTVIEKLTPAATLKMIRDGINPLEKSFDELEQYFDKLPEEYRMASESYSRFLYGLERNREITPEERDSYIGVYRLVRQIEKTEGAAVGTLVNAQAELHFANLLSAVRSGKFKSLDAKVGDSLGTVAELIRKGQSISEQIERAFVQDVKEVLTEVSYTTEDENAYDREQLEQYRAAASRADRDCAAMLQRGEIPVNAANLLAAEALNGEVKNLFRTGQEEDRGTELWELLDRPEEFEDRYEETVTATRKEVEEASVTEAETSLDVRDMQLTHKQLTVAAAVAKSREFFLPMYIGEQLTRVHLTLNNETAGAGAVDITVKFGEGRELQGSFCFKDGSLQGILRVGSQNEVMKTKVIADIFKEEAGEKWSVGDINVVASDTHMTAGRGTDADIENVELYRVAKVFLHAAQQGEMTDEN